MNMMVLLPMCVAGLSGLGIAHTLRSIRRDPEAAEAEVRRTSIWGMAGGGVVMLAMLPAPLPVRIALLGAASGLIGRGALLNRRLRARRTSEFVAAGARATNSLEVIESLEGQRGTIVTIPFRYRAFILGTKGLTALGLGRIALIAPSLRTQVMLGTFAAGLIVWMAADVLAFRRQAASRRLIDVSIDRVLEAAEAIEPGAAEDRITSG